MMDHAVLLRDLDPFEPCGKALRDVFLPEALRTNAGGIPFHRHRPAANVRQHDGRHGFVVAGEVTLGNAVCREEHFLRMRDHETTPSSRGWRSLPWTVHSLKASDTAISGRTQCARSRGSPRDLVKGALSISIASSRCRSESSSFVSKPVPILPAKANSPLS